MKLFGFLCAALEQAKFILFRVYKKCLYLYIYACIFTPSHAQPRPCTYVATVKLSIFVLIYRLVGASFLVPTKTKEKKRSQTVVSLYFCFVLRRIYICQKVPNNILRRFILLLLLLPGTIAFQF